VTDALSACRVGDRDRDFEPLYKRYSLSFLSSQQASICLLKLHLQKLIAIGVKGA